MACTPALSMAELRYLIDSNICIYILRNARGPEAMRLAAQDRGSVAASAVSYAEVMLGIVRRDRLAMPRAVALFDQLGVLPFDKAAAQIYMALPFKRNKYDHLIAAHTIALGVALVTNNPRDFDGLAGFRHENWCR
jgi:tRNA(fMet)-specific endonuclease VapC